MTREEKIIEEVIKKLEGLYTKKEDVPITSRELLELCGSPLPVQRKYMRLGGMLLKRRGWKPFRKSDEKRTIAYLYTGEVKRLREIKPIKSLWA